MTTSARSVLKALVPAPVRRAWRRQFGWRWLRGDYPSWEAAVFAAGAAGDKSDRVVAAARAVREGRAAWERDGVTFATAEPHPPLLAALRAVAAGQGGRLEVVDFGGALGSAWRQHRAWLPGDTTWRVVEVPALVAAGRREFADATLSFHATVDEAVATGKPATLLLSSVLQYLPDPMALLATEAGRGWRDIILDRTALDPTGRGRICVQHTPAGLGGGCMACRVFNREQLLAPLARDYELAAEWPVAFDAVDGTAEYRGFHFRRRGAGG
jgi:putative methyltransferase (TIGR04325 family)